MPYLLDVQHSVCRGLATCLVVPLVRIRPEQIPLNLVVEVTVGDEKVFAVVPQLAGVERHRLGPVVDSLEQHRYPIQNAIDFLIAGY